MISTGNVKLGHTGLGQAVSSNTAMEYATAAQAVEPVTPILSRIGLLAEEIASISHANLAAVDSVADRLVGTIPNADANACGQQIQNSVLDALETKLRGILNTAIATSSAISRIERLF